MTWHALDAMAVPNVSWRWYGRITDGTNETYCHRTSGGPGKHRNPSAAVLCAQGAARAKNTADRVRAAVRAQTGAR